MRYICLYDNENELREYDNAVVLEHLERDFEQVLRRRSVSPLTSDDPTFSLMNGYTSRRDWQYAFVEYQLYALVRDEGTLDEYGVYVRNPQILVRHVRAGYDVEVGQQVIQSASPEYVLLADRHPRDPIVGRITNIQRNVVFGGRTDSSRLELTIDPSSLQDTRRRFPWDVETW